MGKTIIIKIGSSTLLTKRYKLNKFRISHIADQVAALKQEGVGVILVVSGAVACGSNFISMVNDNEELRKAAAGAGQACIISVLQDIFTKKKMNIAQLLLTKTDLNSDIQKRQIKRLLKFYIEAGFVSIINENDVLDLNSFGGNDYLALEITKLLQADKLLILSTLKGSIYGVGGGEAKFEVIDILKQNNIQADIINGKAKNSILHATI